MFDQQIERAIDKDKKHQAKKAKKEQASWESDYERDKAKYSKTPEQMQEEFLRRSNENAASTQAGREDAKKFFSENVQGLSPEARSSMQYEANRGIQRNLENSNRKLLGEQGQRGITGRGGVGYAQQRDLRNSANEAQGTVDRDLNQLDRDLALKYQAAIYAGGQGKASEDAINRQLINDEEALELLRRQNYFREREANKQFQRV